MQHIAVHQWQWRSDGHVWRAVGRVSHQRHRENADTKQPVDSMRVVVQITDYESDTLYTDIQGQYALDGRRWPSDAATIHVDDERGKYQSDSKTVTLVFDGDSDSWFKGTANVTVDFDVKPIDKQ